MLTAVDDKSATTENEHGAHRGKYSTEKHKEVPRQGTGFTFYGNEAQGDQHDEEACQEEGEAEDRKTSPTAPLRQDVGIIGCLKPMPRHDGVSLTSLEVG
jgi:hypothetical protein